MGSVLGRASDPPPPSPANAPPHSAVIAPMKEAKREKVDYTNLPCPIPYEDLHLEATWKRLQVSISIWKNGFYSVNYIQSVTPNLSLGTELLWQGEQNKSNIGFSARYTSKKMIENARVLSGGTFVFSSIQNLSEKCHLWGKVDCNAVISAYLERKISTGTSLVLSAELDHVKKNYKFGYGLEFVSRPSYKL